MSRDGGWQGPPRRSPWRTAQVYGDWSVTFVNLTGSGLEPSFPLQKAETAATGPFWQLTKGPINRKISLCDLVNLRN